MVRGQVRLEREKRFQVARRRRGLRRWWWCVTRLFVCTADLLASLLAHCSSLSVVSSGLIISRMILFKDWLERERERESASKWRDGRFVCLYMNICFKQWAHTLDKLYSYLFSYQWAISFCCCWNFGHVRNKLHELPHYSLYLESEHSESSRETKKLKRGWLLWLQNKIHWLHFQFLEDGVRTRSQGNGKSTRWLILNRSEF
jgi:hypothetical protein